MCVFFSCVIFVFLIMDFAALHYLAAPNAPNIELFLFYIAIVPLKDGPSNLNHTFIVLLFTRSAF